jgi:2-polyprenyl-3-methyl-5-hydroxy-6-metoxy-1,4-benzoquinol methylase
MKVINSIRRACWCGNAELVPFSPAYAQCEACTTLVSLESPPDEKLLVKDDETDFYGKQYWLAHQTADLGFGDIQSRVRRDLAERNLHWLQTLLRYCPPPAKTLEVGCAHGSFVALMQQAGYQTSGVEMSPWVVDFGKKTFDIKVELGPIEDLTMPAGELDAIVLMDVLEHLPDPLKTLARCLELLKPDGLLLIQTPQFRPDRSFEQMVASKDRFLEMLIPDEHIYLFSTRSVTEFFQRLNARSISFEPAIFAHYDMFLAVSRAPLKLSTTADIEGALLGSSGGRMVLAMLDLRTRELSLATKLEESEKDRIERAMQIETLNTLLQESEADRLARSDQIHILTSMLHESEADRAARAQQIDTLTAMVNESEKDRFARGEQITTLTAMIRNAESARLGEDNK